MLKGFTGQILDINLSTNEIKKNKLDEKLAEQFLGGAGYACATLFPLISQKTDPLGPENILFFMTGPMTGTLASSTGRMVVCAKSPYTNIWGESNSCAEICIQIKKAGYDGIMIKGTAKSPLFLEIIDDQVALKDATTLWGKGIIETHELLLKQEAPNRGKCCAIGPAGENLVKYAIIGDGDRAFGRTGMGAVMGSKKLKAIYVAGTKKVEVAKPAELTEIVKEVNKALTENVLTMMFTQLGTAASVDLYNASGEMPVKYYRGTNFADFDNISGATISEKILKKNRPCFSCPIGCGRTVAIGENELKLPTGNFEGPEYETIASFSSMIMNGDLKLLLKANYMCNDLGVDTISSGSVISLLMDLVEQNKITSAQLDGLDLKWGNMPVVFELLEKISRRQGIGTLLAEGSLAVGKKFGIDPEQIAAVGKTEPTYHDMRAINGMALSFAISPHYGGSHNSCDMYMNAQGIAWPELDIEPLDAKDNTPNLAAMTAKVMSFRAFYSSFIMCVFCNPPVPAIAKYLELATGMPADAEKIKVWGERILTLKRLFNLKMGHLPKDEHIPKILLTPLPQSGQAGNVPDVEMLTKEFYKFLQWDVNTGKPSSDKIKALGLTEYAKF